MPTRRTASDSNTSAKEVMAAALKSIEAPAHEPLYDGAEPYWREILSARANTDWPAEDLTMAAKLANLMLMHKQGQERLHDEGPVLENASGTAMSNPLVTIVKTYMSDISVLRRDLQIHGRGKNGEARDVGKRRGQRKVIERGAVDSDLIARPRG